MGISKNSYCRRVIEIRLLLLLLFWLLPSTSCTNNRRLLNEENPFYKRGIQLQLDGNYDDAIAAFKQCLKFSPNSYKAHLQVAVIYEDHKHDYPQSIVHYKMFIENATNIDDIEIAQQWLNRAEKKYFEKLRFVYGNSVVDRDYSMPPKDETQHPSSDSMDGADQWTVADEDSDVIISKDETHLQLENTELDSAGDNVEYENVHHDDYYVVQAGDTLTRIAEKLTGDENDWRDLYEFNRDKLESPELLQIGQKLKIPPSLRLNSY